jgi:hypothetical protein
MAKHFLNFCTVAGLILGGWTVFNVELGVPAKTLLVLGWLLAGVYSIAYGRLESQFIDPKHAFDKDKAGAAHDHKSQLQEIDWLRRKTDDLIASNSAYADILRNMIPQQPTIQKAKPKVSPDDNE